MPGKKALPVGSRGLTVNPKAGAITLGVNRGAIGPVKKNPSETLSGSITREVVKRHVKGPSEAPPPIMGRFISPKNPKANASPVARENARFADLQKERAWRERQAPTPPRGVKPSGLERIKGKKLVPRLPSGFRDSVAVTGRPAVTMYPLQAQDTTIPAAVLAKLDAAPFSMVPETIPVSVPIVDEAPVLIASIEPPNPIAKVAESVPASRGPGPVLFLGVALFAGFLFMRGA